jgi:predicted metal-dependent hydrolase
MHDELERLILDVRAAVLRCPFENAHVYGDFLAQTYYYVCHSTRLLGLAAGRCRVDRDALHRRFARHISEETAHERLALDDLNALGLSLERFPELAVTRAFYEAQYYKIEHLDPTALFGYILLLEGVAVSVGPEVYRRVIAAHSSDCAKFLKLHAEEDVDHLPKAFAQIDGLPPSEKEDIRLNMIQSAELYSQIVSRTARRQDAGDRSS